LGPGNLRKGDRCSFDSDLEIYQKEKRSQFLLGPGNLPQGKGVVSFNWDLEILPKGKAAVSFTWDLENFTKRKSRSQF
jgi:hypothetical protein